MNILIKDIDPPGSCDDCPFAVVEWDEFGGSNSYAFCTATNERISRGTDKDVATALLNKLPNCPIEPFSTVNKDSLIGEWMYGENNIADCVDGYYCSLCDFFVPWDYKHKSIDFIKEYNYCPNCGRRMIIKE